MTSNSQPSESPGQELVKLVSMDCFGENELGCTVSSEGGAIALMAVINRVLEAGNKTSCLLTATMLK